MQLVRCYMAALLRVAAVHCTEQQVRMRQSTQHVMDSNRIPMHAAAAPHLPLCTDPTYGDLSVAAAPDFASDLVRTTSPGQHNPTQRVPLPACPLNTLARLQDPQASDCMSDVMTVMGLSGLMGQAIKLVKGVTLTQDDVAFNVAVFSVLSWFKVRGLKRQPQCNEHLVCIDLG
eukprot:GHRQ01033871.1.p1 GENE.GHRQ01033871.1~~GHRQ01033871.1.p1  ORF type:complete len:174 (-),score=58.44 GHRQ01033871.1:29-550(-)